MPRGPTGLPRGCLLDIPRAVVVKRRVGVGVPRRVFVVAGAVAEVAVEEADESVAECSQGAGLGVAGG